MKDRIYAMQFFLSFLPFLTSLLCKERGIRTKRVSPKAIGIRLKNQADIARVILSAAKSLIVASEKEILRHAQE